MLILIACVLIACTAHAYLFFSSQLKQNGVTESVGIGARTYTVRNGQSDAGIWAFQAVRLAYAKALAERDPILGLEGTDVDALRSNTDELQRTMEDIALLQDTTDSAESVRTSLYPFEFLHAAADLETRRLHFISSGSQGDLATYMNAYSAVITSGISDSAKLLGAFKNETRESNSIRLPGFSGTITTSSSIASLESMPAALRHIRRLVIGRTWCLRGITWICPPLATASGIESTQIFQQETEFAPRSMQPQVRSILRAVAATTTYDLLYAPVRLEHSACLASLPSPYAMEAAVSIRKNFDLLHYIDNLFFIPVAGTNGPMPQYLHTAFGLTYLKVNPLTFYFCPYLLSDISTTQAILKTTAIARTYTDVPNSFRTNLMQGTPSEQDATAYVQEALIRMRDGTLPEPYIRAIISASIMFSQKSAGLDAVVGQIVYINKHDLQLAKNGAPFDLSARTLFLTHAATASLYLFPQIGALSPLTPSTSSDTESLFKQYLPLSTILTLDTEETIVSDMRRMNQAESGNR